MVAAERGRSPLEAVVKIVKVTTKHHARKSLVILAAIGLIAGIAATAAPASALEPALRCSFKKQNAALKRIRAINKCYQKPASLGTQDPDQMCIDKADQRFRVEFMQIEAFGGCMPATGDVDVVADFADDAALGLFQVLPGACLPQGAECGSIGFCCSPYHCVGAIGSPVAHCG
jgi:hypothetical protein